MLFAVRFLIFSMIVLAFARYAPPGWKDHETALMIGMLALAGVLFLL